MAVGGVPDPIDVYVGSRLRLARTASGLSLAKMGEAIGISSQQAQKYEKGINRLGARRLYQLAQLFDLSVGFFFRDMPAELTRAGKRPPRYDLPPGDDVESLDLGAESGNQEVLRLVSAFLKMPDPKLRTEVTALVTAMQKSVAKKRQASDR